MKKMNKNQERNSITTVRSSPSFTPPPSSVLVAVTGMSPAILTETAWALSRERPAIMPSKVVAFGTTRSRDHLRRDLLDSGIWENLRATLKAGSDELIFGDAGEHIRVFSRRGKELDDIRTPEDNSAAADFILEHLRQFAENPEIRIVASIAGGRKTMGALLYAAMTLIGRETDRLTHVLADEALEQRRDPRFFFPHTAAEAKGVTLADVPFVPLRNRFVELGRMPGGFSTLVRHYAQSLAEAAEAAIRFDDRAFTVTVNERPVILGRRAYIVLKFAVHLAETGATPIGLDIDNETFKAFVADSCLYPAWLANVDVTQDLRRELSAIRKAFDAADIAWKPGKCRDALRLPPFRRTDAMPKGGRKTEIGKRKRAAR